MHLPFTFATGEALLYQTGFPLHGFPDTAQTNGSRGGGKAKKGRADDETVPPPKSLLGALMSQDTSVYVCQPDPEPRDPPTYDPLLATLDSLTLDGEEPCSNSELFSALENLGLNAEDLELLLLDERMIQVELDDNRVPSLGDLLTNNEILSYLHGALEHEHGPDGEGGAHPPAAPFMQLSQQLQQHAGAGREPPKAQPGVPNELWAETENLPSRHQHHAVLKASPLNGELLQPGPQWQLQLQQHQPLGDHSLHGHLNGTTNRLYVPSRHSTFPLDADVEFSSAHQGYQQQQQQQVQSSAIELEQLLGLSHHHQEQQQHGLLPLEAYSVFHVDSGHSKVREPKVNRWGQTIILISNFICLFISVIKVYTPGRMKVILFSYQ